MAAIIGVIATIMVAVIGHAQGQEINTTQPMKLASLEALFDTENPASLSVLTIKNPFTDDLILNWRIPGALSFMEYNRFTGEVNGINQLQTQYEQIYGPGNYVPPPVILYWSFRAMVGAGFLMILLSLVALFIDLRNLYAKFSWFLKTLIFTVALPYLANTTGWILTEVGRFPWIVYELVKLQDGVSKVVTGGMFLTSLIGLILLYGLIIIATVFLMLKFAKAGPVAEEGVPAEFTPSLVNPPES
jgi:cytochrome d ubiquinol oxidase subunit I